MKILKYWHKQQSIINNKTGQTMDIIAWGGSNESQENAVAKAKEKFSRIIAKLQRGEDLNHYTYSTGEIREELLEEIYNRSGELVGAITRNRYGAAVLNAANVFIADIDVPIYHSTPFDRFLALFGKKLKDKNYHVEKIKSILSQDSTCQARIYETHSGLRVFVMHKNYDPQSSESKQLLQTLGSDPLYQKLCLAQHCYRARLTPKPWRIDCYNLPWQFPRESDHERKYFDKWLDEYSQKSRRFGVCRLLETVGSGKMTENAKQIIEIHDAMAIKRSTTELA